MINNINKLIFATCLFMFLGVMGVQAASCGSATGVASVTTPNANLCSDSSSPRVEFSGNNWKWNCGSGDCIAPDPNAPQKFNFAATEMPTYTGNINSPDTANLWLQWFCHKGFPAAQSVFQNYDNLGCTEDSMLGTHGGCPNCVMANFSVRKKASGSACGSAAGTRSVIAPVANKCADGSNPRVDFTATGWTWNCGSTTCTATDPNAPQKFNFAATEMPEYTGDINMPNTATVWLQYFCWLGFPSANQPIFLNYDNLGCVQDGSLGTHGGCPNCVMSKFTIRKKLTTPPPTPVNGNCGTSSEQAFSVAPTTNLCSVGTPSSVIGAGPWEWTCSGTDGGLAASCITLKRIDGTCGSANGISTTTAPTANLCSQGNATAVTGTDPWYWTCAGVNGGSTDNCSSVAPACGTANGGSFLTAPSTGLCSSGNPVAITNWFDYSYLKRKSITVSNGTGSVISNSAIVINIAYDSDMQTDFDDLRFTLNDNVTQLSYWVESKTDSSTAKVWVRIPTIPTTGTTIYAYYGNAGVSTLSNSTGFSSTIFTDNFTGNNISNWTPAISGNADIVPDADRMRLRIYRCSYATATKSLGNISGQLDLSFVFQRYNDNSWADFSDWAINVNGVDVNPQGGYGLGTTLGGSYNYSIDNYKVNVNGNTEIRLKLYPSPSCGNGDHSNSYVWIDNMVVKLANVANTTNTIGAEESNAPVFGATGPWSWKCAKGAVVSATCTATQTDPACGSANGQSFESIPTTNLCAVGAVTPIQWLDGNYSKRKKITLSNSSGSVLSNYAVVLTIPYNSSMRSDFADLRFTSSDGQTQLNYWLESKTDSSVARVWVKIPSVPTAGTNIYMYYGNSSAVNAGNGDNVFTFFDDFSGSSLNTSKWTEVDSSGYINQSGGLLAINNGPVNWGNTGIYSVTNFPRTSLVIEGKYLNNCTAGAYYRDTTMLWMKDTTTSVDYPAFTNAFYSVWYNNSFYWTNYESGTAITGTGSLVCNTQYKFRQIVKASGGAITQLSSDGGITWVTARDSSFYNGLFKVGFTHYDGGVVYIDNIIVRPYVSTEPTFLIDTVEQVPADIFLAIGPWSWYCTGGGKTSPLCGTLGASVAGKCPVVTSSATTPTATCVAGNPSVLTTNADSWTWTCQGVGSPINDSCSVNKLSGASICGTANAQSFDSLTSASSNLCSSESPLVSGSFIATGPSWIWACKNGTSDAIYCYATKTVVVNCGTSSGQAFTALTSGSSDLCEAGYTVDTFTTLSDSWTWYCKNAGGTLSTMCSATKQAVLNAINLKNPNDGILSSPTNADQCLYCNAYYSDAASTVLNTDGMMNYSTGIVTPLFQFTYFDPNSAAITKYQYAVSEGTDPNAATGVYKTGWLTSVYSKDVTGKIVTIRPGITIDRAAIAKGGIATGKLEYGKTYNWWIRVGNATTESAWSSAKVFNIDDHQWPKVAVAATEVKVNVDTQVCSTAIDINDACLPLCWQPGNSEVFNFASPSAQLQTSSWKCSVCYDASGNAILCQNAPLVSGKTSNFEWAPPEDSGATQAPIFGTTNPIGQAVKPNPKVKFKEAPTKNARLRIKIFGSECPLAASVNADKIRPIWVED